MPKLLNAEPRLLVIEMTLVEPSFLLDVAQSALDEPIDFPEGTPDEWWQRVDDDFGPERFPTVQDVFYELQNKYQLYYYDLAPRNLNFGPGT